MSDTSLLESSSHCVTSPESSPASSTAQIAAAKAMEIHARLCRSFQCPIAYFHHLDPLSELVSSMLSHRTRNADSGRAFKSLRRALPSWEQVRDAPVAEIEAAIFAATWPEQKAPRIKRALLLISEWRCGSLNLDFLGELSESDARTWLERIPGVGPKTSAAVLSFSTMRVGSLPVDSHHHRVAARTGLLPNGMAVGPAHAYLRAQLPSNFSAQELYDNHEVLMLHGQKVCHFSRPDCVTCVLLDLCPTGQSMLAPALGAAGAFS